MPTPEICRVYSARDVPEAYFVAQALNSEGISARVVGENLQHAVGELPYVNTAPQVWVRSEEYDRARVFIHQLLSNQSAVGPAAVEWTCPRCGEVNTPAFELCWHCQYDRVRSAEGHADG